MGSRLTRLGEGSLPSLNLFNFEPGRVEVVPGVHAWVMSVGLVDVVRGVQMFHSCMLGDYKNYIV